MARLHGHVDCGDEAGRLCEDVLGEANNGHGARLPRRLRIKLLEEVAHLGWGWGRGWGWGWGQG